MIQTHGHRTGRTPEAGGPVFEPMEPRLLLDAADIVINEIMYHPAGLPEPLGLEYVELLNTGADPVNLNGWRLNRGADYTFGDVTMAAGDTLVVAADTAAFLDTYTAFTGHLVGGPDGWDGRLSNSGEDLELEDAAGARIDLVTYADEGDWSVRVEGPLDHHHTGWVWADEHDGGGKSLELVNPALSNACGQNWAASLTDGGTPGEANSVASANVAPLVLDVGHLPAIPSTSDPVTITARIVDELAAGLTVRLYTRVDEVETEFTAHDMFDDGEHGDGTPGDGVYGAVLDPQPVNLTIVEFYVEALDAGGHERTWPGPVPGHGQVANALYQVDNAYDAGAEWVPGSLPIYRLIMTKAERDELINEICGGGDERSNAQMNGTFISADGAEPRVRYQVGIRNRGAGSRDDSPYNHRVNFTSDAPWNGVAALNLNAHYGYLETIGSAVWQAAGLADESTRGAEVRVNGVDRAAGGRLMYGAYAAVEALDSDWAERWFPDDSAGDVWRLSDQDLAHGAELTWEGWDPDPYRNRYMKQTNAAQDEWDDLINMIYELNFAPTETFVEAISPYVNIDQWVRFLAVDALIGNREGGLTSGRGDDYAMYQGVVDPRFILVPHDLDTLLGEGDAGADYNRSIFVYDGVDGLGPFLHHPDVVARYYAQFLDLIDTVFAPENFNPLIDHVLGGWVPANVIQDMKDYVVARIHSAGGILDQIPMPGLTVTSPLPTQDGYPYTTSDSWTLSGTADGTTRSVSVNGALADWTPRPDGRWTFDSTDFDNGYEEQTLVTANAEVAYHVPTAGEDAVAWTDPAYDDAAWTDSISEGLAGLLLTEIATGDVRYVELQNVSSGDIDTAGWVVAANDPSAGASGLVTTLWNLPASVAPGDVLYRTDQPGDAYWGETLPWDPEGPGWVMLVDDAGALMDFVAWGYTQAEIAALSVTVNGFPITVGSQWTGDGADVGTTGPGDPAAGFVAFNDHVSGPATHPNATTYRANGTASGYLKDIATGADTPVTLTTSASGVVYDTKSHNPAAGTDAYDVFNGYVDFSEGTNTSIETGPGANYTHTFTGLDTGDVVTYDVTGTSIRGGGYDNRWIRVQIQGADAFTPASSTGLGIVVIDSDEVALWCGENDWADQGFVVGWTGVDPGPDGAFSLVSTQYTGAIPTEVNPSGMADGSKAYALTGIRLEEVAPAGPLSFLKRTGGADSDGAGDFARDASGSKGAQNAGMTVPFGTVTPATMGLGYSGGAYDAYVATDVATAMQGAGASLWTRVAFTAPDLPSYDGLTLRVRYDDGFVAYLNGVKVAEANAPASPAWDSAATAEHDGAGFQDIDISANLADLLVGDNVLAVHGLNTAAADADFLIQAELIATRGTPGLTMDLVPGINRITVETHDGPDGTGSVLDTDTIDIWYDTGLTADYPRGIRGGAPAASSGRADETPPVPSTEGVTLAATVRTRDSYLPGTPLLVRVEVVDQADGSVYRDLWDATATLSVVGNPGVGLDVTEVTLYNGLGSALVTATGAGDFTLQVDVAGLQTSKALVDWSAQPVATVSGGIAADETWSGVVHVTGGDFAVPDLVTLTLDPGTLVLVDGVASGTGGADIDVAGAVRSLGTDASPVTFTAYVAGENWGEFDFASGEPSTFQYTSIHQAGHSPGVGHTGTGPAIRTSGTAFVFDHANLTDNAGKVMYATSGTDLVFRDSTFARSVMGPEITGTALLFEDSWIADMHGADDDDGIYVHDQQAGQQCIMRGAVVANVDDDGVDTLGSDLTIQDTIVRDAKDKAVSVYGGSVTIDHGLIVENNKAPEDPTVASIAAKTTGGGTATVTIDHSTIVATATAGVTDVGIQSHNKYGVASGTIVWNVTNSIIVATDPIDAQAPYLASDIHVDYTDVFDEAWPGTGNLQRDPLFANPAAHDYHLQAGSPGIDAGDPAYLPLDADGSRTDMGYFSGAAAAPGVTVTIEATDANAAEQNTDPGTFTIFRTGEVTDPLTVHYSVGGTADAADYTPALSGEVVILAGDADATVTVTPVDDPDFELDETVVLTLTADPAYAIGVASSAMVMIADNDQPSGSLTEDTVWTSAGGPYYVTADLTVPAGISLTVTEGTTVFFAPGAELTVRGLLQADGAKYAPIRLTRLPGSGATWGGIQFDGTMQDNRITYAVVEYARTDNGSVGLDASNLLLDHVMFDHTDFRRIRSQGSALVVRNSTFTDLFGPGEAPTWNNHNEHIWGTAGAGLDFIVEDNRFGTTKGHSDAIDVNGADGMRLQILNNTFMGGGDDALDLEGDAHIEGNRFMHFHKDQWNTGTGNANAISAGAGKQYLMTRNRFLDLDHVAQVKQDAFLTFTNNTVYDLDYAAIYFLRPGQPGSYGKGAYVDGDIFQAVPETFADVAGGVTLTVNRSIVDAAWHTYGTGNLDADPRLADPSGGDFRLLAGSPAIGTGPMGLDMGYDVPAGVVVRTDVPAVTYLADATFEVGGPGVTAYRYQLDGGGWSAEQPVETPLVLSALGDAADHTLQVIGKSSAGVWQDAAAAAVWTWHVDTAHRQVFISEVLADNESVLEAGGVYPDLIELYADAPAGAPDFDLEGYTLTDGANAFAFPAGAVVPAGGYLVLYGAEDPGGAPGTWLGFGLQAEGDDLSLVAPDGVTVADTVAFGPQAADFSIGRAGPTRAWTLAQPTFGAANTAARTGRQDTLVINEWFARGDVAFVDDFVELYNPDTLPVALDGLYLTDNPVSQTAKAPLGPLSFVGAGGHAAFRADNRATGGHVNFRLTADEGMLALFGSGGTQLDQVLYAPQTTDFSQGRVPDAGDAWDDFVIPSPGLANPKVASGQTVVDTLVAAGDTAAYHVPTTGEDPLAWTAVGYDDGLWTHDVVVDEPRLLLTEIETGDTDWVEIQNVSDADIVTAGWVVLVNDPSGGSINDVLATAWDLPASVAAGQVLYRTDDALDNYWGADIPWDAGGAGWAMVLDSGGAVVDFLAWNYAGAEIGSLAIDYGPFTGITVGGQWTGDGAEVGDGTGGGVPGPEQDAFAFGATWDYMHPQNATDPAGSDADFDTTWMQATGYDGPAFDQSGPGILGYGGIRYGSTATDIGNPGSGNRYTAYFRREFTLADDMVNMGIEVLSDDGAVIYIDGAEVARNNVSDPDTYFARADGYTYPGGGNTEEVTRTLSISDLGAGTHLIAVSVHNSSPTSSDIGFGMRLFGQPEGNLGTALERLGETDRNSAADFDATRTPTQGAQNAGLTVPFGATAPVVTGLGFSGGPFDAQVATDVSAAMLGTSASLWARIGFQAADVSTYNSLVLRVQYDDGFVAYLNGVKIAERNAPASPAWDSAATGEHPDAEAVLFERIDVSDFLGDLLVGDNVLAVHGLNLDAADADFLISAELQAASTPFDPNLLALLNGLRVSEIMYHHPAGSDFDFLELTNIGAEDIDLAGVRIGGGIGYTFAGGTLAPGQYVVLADDVAQFQAWYGPGINVAGQYTGSLSNGGEDIILRLSEPYDAAVLRFDYSDSWFGAQTDGDGLSLVVLDPSRPRRTWDEGWSWRPSSDVNGSPGGADRVPDYPLGSIVVNEVLAHQDTDPPGDWIEVVNRWDQPVDLDGWFLSDSAADLAKFEITTAAVPDTVLDPGEYMVLTEAQHFGEFAPDPGKHTGFALSEHGDQVWLSSGAGGVLGTYRETVDFGASDNGVTLGRYTTSTGAEHFVALSAPSMAAGNAYPKVGPVVINELMYHPVDGQDEFLELYNSSAADVPLYDPANPDHTWQFTGGVTFAFPTGVTLRAGEYLLVTRMDPAAFRTEFGIDPSVPIYGPFEGGTALADGGETVELSKPSDPDPGTGFFSYIVVDRVAYNDNTPWPTEPDGNGPSLERLLAGAYGDDAANWGPSQAAGGSPAAPNAAVPTQQDWVGNTDNHWNHAANWSATVVPDFQTAAVFNGAGTYQPTLYQDGQAKGVSFETAGWTLGGIGATLTLGQGSLASAGAGANVVGPDVALTADSSWTIGTDNTLEVAAVAGGDHALTKNGPGTLVVGGADGLAALAVNDGTVRLTGGGGNAVVTDAVLIDAAAALDLAAGNLIVDYTGGPNPYAAVAGAVASGYNAAAGGYWDGTGIASSAAAADSRKLTALAVIDNNDPDIKIGGLADLDGVPAPAESVLVKYTYYGDANLDGVVNSNDYDVIDNAWLLWTTEGTVPDGGFRWGVGDFNYDGTINSNDYDRIDNAFLLQSEVLGGGGPGPMPTAPGALSGADLAAAGELSSSAPPDARLGADGAAPSLGGRTAADPASFDPAPPTRRGSPASGGYTTGLAAAYNSMGYGTPVAPPSAHAAGSLEGVSAPDGAVDLLASPALEIPLGA